MSKSIVKVTPATVDLEGGEIPAEWVLSGNPKTKGLLLVETNDLLAQIVIWECGAVSYKWHYDRDEAYIVLSGEGFVTDETGEERRFGAGDVAFFPAGTNTVWRHPDHFRKVAFLKHSFSRPAGFSARISSIAFTKILRALGIKSSLPRR